MRAGLLIEWTSEPGPDPVAGAVAVAVAVAWPT
jgi:hypothetical protein